MLSHLAVHQVIPVGQDRTAKLVPLLPVAKDNCLLNHIVGVLRLTSPRRPHVIQQQLQQVGRRHDLLDDRRLRRLVAQRQRLLHHVAAALLLRQLHHLAQHAPAEPQRHGGRRTVDQVLRLTSRRLAHLDQVVGVHVLHQLARVRLDPVQQRLLLRARRRVDALLHHAAPVHRLADLRLTPAATRHLAAVRRHRLDHARARRRVHARQAALHHVVGVHVRAQLHHERQQAVQQRRLHVRRSAELRLTPAASRHLDQLLHAARAVRVLRRRAQLRTHGS